MYSKTSTLTGAIAVAASLYWSSTPHALNASFAWYVNFNFGDVNTDNKTGDFRVRAVRGGP